MELKFAKFEPSTALENAGTLGKYLGPKGTFSVTPNSIKGAIKENGEIKRVFLILDKGDGNGTALLTCSKAVSEGIRNKSIKVKDLAHYDIVASEETGVPFLSVPASTNNMFTVKVSEATAKPEAKPVKWSDLVAV